MLTIDTIPLKKFSILDFRFAIECGFEISFLIQSQIANCKSKINVYLFSLCTVWQRQRRQNFLNSNLSGVVFLFFVVT
jgi:hypothetical protein